jgi:hypothetical protein
MARVSRTLSGDSGPAGRCVGGYVAVMGACAIGGDGVTPSCWDGSGRAAARWSGGIRGVRMRNRSRSSRCNQLQLRRVVGAIHRDRRIMSTCADTGSPLWSTMDAVQDAPLTVPRGSRHSRRGGPGGASSGKRSHNTGTRHGGSGLRARCDCSEGTQAAHVREDARE